MTDERKLIAIKAMRTLVWLTIESSVVYVVVAGARGRTDRRVALAGAIVAAEILVFAGNGFRCPLTTMAESLGTDDGSVTDIFLPHWFARNLPAIHVPVVALAATLHVRNLRRRAQSR